VETDGAIVVNPQSPELSKHMMLERVRIRGLSIDVRTDGDGVLK
jgi:hypothetical protein